MKAFVGHSFDERDSKLVTEVKEFLEGACIKCTTGERPQNEGVSEKIKTQILDSDIFVGLFTRNHTIPGKGFFKKSTYTTSNWVIQESGFAIATEKELIFLIEEGICDFPKLQGDLEYIPFDRASMDKLFKALNPMLASIKSKSIMALPAVEVQKKRETTEEHGLEKETPQRKAEAAEEFFNAVFTEKNLTKAKKIFDGELIQSLEEKQKPAWKATALRCYDGLGDAGAFRKLLEYVEENKSDPEVVIQLAGRYEEMKEYQKAKDAFLAARKLYNTSKKEDKERAIDCCKRASLCLVCDNQYDTAIELLSKLLSENTLKEHKGIILAALANVAKTGKDMERFFVYAEGALDKNPENTSLRFDLAYHYDEEGHCKLSLLHYDKLRSARNPMGLNNMGVGYESLKMPAKSKSSYCEAATLDSSIAMANLANSYMERGFVNDARREIDRANKLYAKDIDVHVNVGRAAARLESISKEENSKEEAILKEADNERRFRLKYSESFYCEKEVVRENIVGVWETPWGDVNLAYDENLSQFTIEAEQDIKNTVTGGLQSVFMGESQIKVNVNIVRMSGRYINVKEKGESLLTQKTVYGANVYMIINEDHHTIDVMEKGKEEKLDIYQWKKKLTAPSDSTSI